MKKALLFSISVAIIFLACEQTVSSTQLTGELRGLENKDFLLVKVESYFPGIRNNSGLVANIHTDENARFELKLGGLEKGFYQIIDAGYPRLKYDLYLEPGDSIHVFQSKWDEAPKFSLTGRGAEKLNT